MWRNFLRWAGTKMIIIASNKDKLSDVKWLENRIRLWKHSPERKMQLDGERYYKGLHDILKKRRTVIDENGKPVEVKMLPNNRNLDNEVAFYADQKTNYLFGQPLAFNSRDKQYVEQLKTVLGTKRFDRFKKKVGLKACNTGICWVYPYIDNGQMKFKAFPAYEILPFWVDTEEEDIVKAVRLYIEEKPNATTPLDIIEKVEIYSAEGIDYYTFENENLVPDVTRPHAPHMVLTTGKKTEERNWTQVPLIPFKFNSDGMPLLARCKNLQDAINELVSNCKDVIEEDPRNTILVLENYDGQNLAELRRNIAQYAAIKVRSGDGARGDVRTLQIEFNAENYEKVLAVFKKAMLKNCRGFDLSELKSGSPNQMNIKSIYSDIDLDANNTETECQASMEQLLWFVNRFLNVSGDPDVDVIFNRDGVVNEVEINTMLFQGGLRLSQETLMTQCPMVDDPEEELDRVKKEEQEAMDAYAGAMPGMGGAPAPGNPAQGGLNNGQPNK